MGYEHLFKEGVLTAEKNFNAPKHSELKEIPNLQVIKALTSLKSRGYVKEQFAWRHYYWSLTNEGIQYLRDFLHLPPEIVPATLKRQAPRETRPRASAAPRAGGVKPRQTERPTGRLTTRLELLDLDQLQWSSEEDSAEASQLSRGRLLTTFCIL